MVYLMSNLRRLTINLEENQTHFVYKNERSIYTLNLEQHGSKAAYETVSCAVSEWKRLSALQFQMTCKVCFIHFPFGEHRDSALSLAGKWADTVMPVIGTLQVVLQIEYTKELFLNNKTFPKL